jgi:hypothetical protein
MLAADTRRQVQLARRSKTMPLDYRIDGNRITITASGKVTPDHFDKLVERLRSDSAWSEVTLELSDFRDAEFSVRPDSITQLARQDATRLPSVLRRAVVVSTDLQYGLARMYCSLMSRSGQDVRPFRDLDAATRWLESGTEGEGT